MTIWLKQTRYITDSSLFCFKVIFLNVFFTDLRPCGFIIFVIQQISLSSFNFYATNSSTELAVLKSQQIILAKKVSFL